MKTIEDKHKCFKCGKTFNWQAQIKSSSSGMTTFIVDGSQADISFVDEGVVEVKAKCPLCSNYNSFQSKVN